MRVGRIQRMSFRLAGFAIAMLAVGILGVGCGGEDGGSAEVTAEVAPTAEPTATPEVTATPVPPTATVEPTADKPRFNIPNRGYNSYGDPDAPITMFDFSDFL